MANTITLFRMAAGIVLLLCPVFSPAFFVLYIAAGVSDMLDGFVARKTDTVSELGARLDTMADFVLVVEKNRYRQRAWGQAGYDGRLCACGRMPDQAASDPAYSRMAVWLDRDHCPY